MALDPKIRSIVNQNLDTSISIYNEIKSSKDALTKFTIQFGKVENNFDFIHGYIMGDLQGSSFGTARTMLSRPLTKEEQEELVSLIQSKRVNVSDLIIRLRNA